MKCSLRNKFILIPVSFDDVSLERVEDAWSTDEVFVEGPYELLAIRKVECTLSFLVIIFELSFVFSPILIYIVKVTVVKWLVKLYWILIIKHTKPFEFILHPLPTIRRFTARVTKNALTVHLVLFPLAIE